MWYDLTKNESINLDFVKSVLLDFDIDAWIWNIVFYTSIINNPKEKWDYFKYHHFIKNFESKEEAEKEYRYLQSILENKLVKFRKGS